MFSSQVKALNNTFSFSFYDMLPALIDIGNGEVFIVGRKKTR